MFLTWYSNYISEAVKHTYTYITLYSIKVKRGFGIKKETLRCKNYQSIFKVVQPQTFYKFFCYGKRITQVINLYKHIIIHFHTHITFYFIL